MNSRLTPTGLRGSARRAGAKQMEARKLERLKQATTPEEIERLLRLWNLISLVALSQVKK